MANERLATDKSLSLIREMMMDGALQTSVDQWVADHPDAVIEKNVRESLEASERAFEAAETIEGKAKSAATSESKAANSARAAAQSAQAAARIVDVGVDPTLTIAGAAAESKVVGDKIAEIKENIFEEIKPALGIVQGEYLEKNGTIVQYANWSRTDYVNVISNKKLYISFTEAPQPTDYNGWFDENKGFISTFSIPNYLEYEIDVPSNAKYVMISGSTLATMDKLSLHQNSIVTDIKNLRKDVDDLSSKIITSDEIETRLNTFTNKGKSYNNQRSARFSALFVTDVHADSERLNNAINFISSHSQIDIGVCLGDMQYQNYSENDGTWYTTIVNKCQKPFLTTMGNHDFGNSASASVSATMQMGFDKFIRPTLSKIGDTTINKCYYMRKYDAYKIVVLVLNCFDNDDTKNGSDYKFSRGRYNFQQEQLTWIVSALGSVPTNYHVMICMHGFGRVPNRTETKFNSVLDYDIGWYGEGNAEQLYGIVNAWIKSMQYSNSMTIDGVTTSVNADFRSRSNGAFVGYFTGH